MDQVTDQLFVQRIQHAVFNCLGYRIVLLRLIIINCIMVAIGNNGTHYTFDLGRHIAYRNVFVGVRLY